MKIGIMLSNFGMFGGVRRFVGLANGLVDRGHDVTFYTLGIGLENPSYFKNKAKVSHVLKFGKHGKFDALINGDPDMTEYFLYSDRSKVNKKIVWLCAIYDPKGIVDINPSPDRWLTGKNVSTLKLLNDENAIKISASSWMTDFIKNNTGIQDIETVYGGIDFSVFHPVEGLNKFDKPTVCWSGDTRSFKVSGLMEKTARRVKAVIPNVRFITYKGQGLNQENMAEFIGKCHVFADDTVLAGWHNPVIEAMACGVPVACYDFPGVKDFAFHGATALLSPVNNSLSLSKSIVTLLKDKKLSDILSFNALEVVKRFTWESCIDRFENIIHGEINT